ncbi:g6710 [Coccomyxa viridis]|uniref:G6710 protein n=1 Tax=Coccomyxa viridis TaxID=1274662 RepID=A0ABP1FYD0_9CHLO
MRRACAIILFATGAWGASVNRHVYLGLDTADMTAKLAYNPHPAELFAIRPVSVHIVVPCIGRRSIFRLLASLKPQLEPQDHITVAFDGIDTHNIFEEVNKELASMPGNNKAVMEVVAAKDSGNTPRNKHRHEAGDFVLFADDDNHYTADALSIVRRVVQHDHEALYIFQMQLTKDVVIPIPGAERVVIGEVDTGCAVVPSKYAHLADWTTGQTPYGGDGHYLHTLSELMPRTYFMERIIYVYSGENRGKDV